MFQCRKRQRGCANIKYRKANTLLLSANMGFIAAGHQIATKLKKIQNDDDDTNTKTTPTQRHRNGQHWAPLLTIWAASKTKTKIWSSFVAFFFISSLLILPFQIGCTYVLLSSIRVNVFHFHVACNHCSSTCFLDHICDTVTVFKHQTQRPVKAANWWGTSPPQGSLSFFILRYPNLEKLPILIDFIKKEKTGSTW